MIGRYRSMLGLLIATSFAIPAGGAASMPVGKPEVAAKQSSMIEAVRWRKVCNRSKCHRVWVGPGRHRVWVAPRRHWHRPAVVIRPRVVIRPGTRVVRGNQHVRWCSRHYRSYNPATDQFLGYDGVYHFCNSPYR